VWSNVPRGVLVDGTDPFYDVQYDDKCLAGDLLDGEFGPDAHDQLFQWESPAKISMASVCRESRSVVEKSYSRTFGTVGVPPLTWFNFDIDTLYLVGRSPNGPKSGPDVGSRVVASSDHEFNFLCLEASVLLIQLTDLVFWIVEPGVGVAMRPGIWKRF
jgi:hypothetical protein